MSHSDGDQTYWVCAWCARLTFNHVWSEREFVTRFNRDGTVLNYDRSETLHYCDDTCRNQYLFLP